MECPYCGTEFGTGEAMFDHVSQHNGIRQGLAEGLLLCGTCWRLSDAVGCACRYWCPLSPCNGGRADRPDLTWGLSFATKASYDRHLREGHFIAPSAENGPWAVVAPRPRFRVQPVERPM